MGIQIAGIATNLYRQGEEAHFSCNDVYGKFTSSCRPDIRVYLHARPLPRFKRSQLLTNVNNVWDLYRIDHVYAFTLPYQRLVVDYGFRRADFYRATGFRDSRYPLSYPFDQLLMIGLLAKGLGVLAHACGISYKGKGLLFLGSSGAGKSTLARLFSKQKDATILSDDRVIIRKSRCGYVLYGTPWQGEARFSSPAQAPLRQVFFLGHGRKNRIVSVPATQAAARMFSHSFPAFWDKEGIRFYLDFYSRLVQEIPACELKFRADTSVVDFVQSHTL